MTLCKEKFWIKWLVKCLKKWRVRFWTIMKNIVRIFERNKVWKTACWFRHWKNYKGVLCKFVSKQNQDFYGQKIIIASNGKIICRFRNKILHRKISHPPQSQSCLIGVKILAMKKLILILINYDYLIDLTFLEKSSKKVPESLVKQKK